MSKNIYYVYTLKNSNNQYVAYTGRTSKDNNFIKVMKDLEKGWVKATGCEVLHLNIDTKKNTEILRDEWNQTYKKNNTLITRF